MGNLPQFLNHYRKEIVFVAIIFLTATISFALGYLANREFSRTPIIIETRNSS